MFKKIMPPFFILAAWITIVGKPVFCYASRYVSPSWVGWLPFFWFVLSRLARFAARLGRMVF